MNQSNMSIKKGKIKYYVKQNICKFVILRFRIKIDVKSFICVRLK